MPAGDSSPDALTPHDPGPAEAQARAARLGAGVGQAVRLGAGEVRFGTASWTDPTLVRSGTFYPAGASSPEDRLRFYASQFSLVEIDATYYALPTRQMAERWAERTPADFTFDVKAHALMTGQPSEVGRLPPDLRDALPEAARAKSRLYADDLPAAVVDEVWHRFIDALAPLHASGKLGSVLLQYPRWFTPSRAHRGAILAARDRLGDIGCAVELRNASWFAGDSGAKTLRFLEDHALPYVMVDEPQGFASSVPPIAAVTSPRLAVIRFHGRNAATWGGRSISPAERFRYLYDAPQLAEWIPVIEHAAGRVREMHVIMNNCYANYGTTNALEIAAMVRRAAGEMASGGERAEAGGDGPP